MGVTTSVHAQFLTSHALYNLGPGLCKAVFFNRGSAEPKGSASQNLRVPPVVSKGSAGPPGLS